MSHRAPKLLGDTLARVACQHFVLMGMSYGVVRGEAVRGRRPNREMGWHVPSVGVSLVYVP